MEILKAKEILFPNTFKANNEGKTVVGVLTDVLWHIDEHHEKINQQSKKCKDMPSLPSFFSTFHGFNDSVKKKRAPRLSSSVLSKDVQNLYYILTFSVVQNEVWTSLHADMKQLAECLNCYVKHLEAKQKTRQSSLETVRSPLRDLDVREVDPVISVGDEYHALCVGEYDAIHLDENFTPIDRRKRYEFLHSLQLSVPIEVFRYNRSGSLGTMTFVWKIPQDKREHSTEKSLQVIDSIRSLIPLYHTRSMTREFCAHFGLVCIASPVVLYEVYRSLTGDASAVPNPEIVDCLQSLLHSDYITDSSVVVDLREKNEGRPSKFTRFWEFFPRYCMNIVRLQQAIGVMVKHRCQWLCQFRTCQDKFKRKFQLKKRTLSVFRQMSGSGSNFYLVHLIPMPV